MRVKLITNNTSGCSFVYLDLNFSCMEKCQTTFSRAPTTELCSQTKLLIWRWNLVWRQLTKLVWRSDLHTSQTRPGLSTLYQSRKRKPTCEQTLQRQVWGNYPPATWKKWQTCLPFQPMPITASWGESHLCWATIQSCHQSSKQTQTLLRDKGKERRQIEKEIEGDMY